MADKILSVIATVGSKLSSLSIKDGQLIFIQDKQKIAMDMDGKRVFYNEINELASDASRTNMLAPIAGSYYFVIETAVLWTYRDGGWVRITTPPDEIVRIGVALPELGRAGTLYVDSHRQEISVWDEDSAAYVVVADTTTEITPDEIDALFAPVVTG